MASACVNSSVAMSPDPFWPSPRISFSCDLAGDAASMISLEKPDPDRLSKDLSDFEFRLDDPVAMLPADELFSGGKLVPLQQTVAPAPPLPEADVSPLEPPRIAEVIGSEGLAPSPKAPRCSSRWRELLGLRRQQGSKAEVQTQKQNAIPSKNARNTNSNPRSIRHLLHRNPRSAGLDPSLSLPLLRDSESDSISVAISSRLSLSSSSSSGSEHGDRPRLSLDSDKPNPSQVQIRPRVRLPRPRPTAPSAAGSSRMGRAPVRRPSDGEAAAPVPPRGSSVDSPRMTAAGKVVFQSLERSSSSPGSFNGGPRPKYRGIERSYSANVRIAPVLNVPVCSLRGSGKSVSVFGFGQLFGPQRKEREGLATARSGIKVRFEKEKA
ncbi:uncharacterized protein [Typha latifolia]|uniref:uncharacterized protein n=1 Tax=Typha latifolia TaxID=4733 RepID=UPI003C30B674